MKTKSKVARGRIRVMLAALAAAVLLPAGPAYADHTVTYPGSYWDPPNFYFFGNADNPLESELNMWFTGASSGVRYRVKAKAGSGDGSTDTCYREHGWLPHGYYGRGDNDSRSDVVHLYKTWGVTAVRGHVWNLYSKLCPSGTPRTELFIHSNGIEGTPWKGKYNTEGCIKTSQHARGGMDQIQHLAYRANEEWLYVSL